MALKIGAKVKILGGRYALWEGKLIGISQKQARVQLNKKTIVHVPVADIDDFLTSNVENIERMNALEKQKRPEYKPEPPLESRNLTIGELQALQRASVPIRQPDPIKSELRDVKLIPYNGKICAYLDYTSCEVLYIPIGRERAKYVLNYDFGKGGAAPFKLRGPTETITGGSANFIAKFVDGGAALGGGAFAVKVLETVQKIRELMKAKGLI